VDKIGENEKFLRASKVFQKLGEGKKKRRLLKEAQIKDGRLTKLTANYFQRQEESKKIIQNRLKSIEEVNFDRPEGMSDEEYTRKIVEMEAEKSGILPASPRINIKPTGKVDPDFFNQKSISNKTTSTGNLNPPYKNVLSTETNTEEKAYLTPLLIISIAVFVGILVIATNWEALEISLMADVYAILFLSVILGIVIFIGIFLLIDREDRREEGTFEERRMNPDLNCSDFNLHKIRLCEFKRSKYMWKMYYMGSKGGIYTLSANGTRNYKY